MRSQRELIQTALEKLGPERLKRGLAAFDHPYNTGSFRDCFLALTYGEAGALLADAYQANARRFHELLGLTHPQMRAVIHAFDNTMCVLRHTMRREDLRAMVEAEIAKHEGQPEADEDEDDDFEIEVEVELDEELEPVTV